MIFKKKKKLVENFSIIGTDFVLVKKRQVWTRIYNSSEEEKQGVFSLQS